jgi:hypothetical protein
MSSGLASVGLDSDYRVPKEKVEVELHLLHQAPQKVVMFLGKGAATHGGRERPSDLFNGPASFLPALDEWGSLFFVQRDAVLVATVRAEQEFGPDPAPPGEGAFSPAAEHAVDVDLEDGAQFHGIVSYILPEGRNRLVDFLNTEERFLKVRDGSLARLINKSRIVRIVAS